MRPSAWPRGASLRRRVASGRSPRPITWPSTSGSGRRPPTRPPLGATAPAGSATPWSGARFWGHRSRCEIPATPDAGSTLAAWSGAEALLVRRHRPDDRLARRLGSLEAASHRAGAFQVLVDLEEMLDLLEVVRRDVVQIVEAVG